MAFKTILVTGSTDGIGKQTALDLAALGHRVLLHGRSPRRVDAAAAELQAAAGGAAPDSFVADFSDMEQVRRLAEQVAARHPRLDVLINNAGVFMPRRILTRDGLETTFQVNHLAPVLLTELLLDPLKAAAPSRIINVSSGTHSGADLDFDNLQGERRYDAFAAYALSKLGNLFFTYDLARRLAGTGVTVNALHPGGISTKLLHAGWGGGGRSVKQGAETPVYLATSPTVRDVTGDYFVNRAPGHSSGASRDSGIGDRFMAVSRQLIAQALPDGTPWTPDGR